ncbi:hypothetical protein ACFWUW_26890 [Streptomyces sp. NPDC058655]|uniref:hypothetical protein n=1 Tax=Streptomyces sp. NPDC058655 TaxID=3346577 RepID=UPI00365BF80B
MDAARDPEYLQATAQAVADFKDALEEFLSLHETNHHFARGLAPAELPRNDADPIEIKELRSNLSHRDSEVKPSSACATARQTSSESVSCGGRPSHRVPPISSSIFTYSAVSRASRLFVTQRSWMPCLRSRTHRSNVSTRAAPPVRSATVPAFVTG